MRKREPTPKITLLIDAFVLLSQSAEIAPRNSWCSWTHVRLRIRPYTFFKWDLVDVKQHIIKGFFNPLLSQKQ